MVRQPETEFDEQANLSSKFVASGRAHLTWILDIAINPDRTARNLFDNVRWSPTHRATVHTEHRS